MVLESLTSPENAENKYYFMLLLGFLFSAIAAVLSYSLQGPSPSLLFVFFTAIPAIPIMYAIIKYEEGKDIVYESEKKLLKEHVKALRAFIFLFIGMVLGMTLIFTVVPSEVKFVLFETQLDNFLSIQNSSPHTGMVTGGAWASFSHIFFNNVRVLVLSVIFSFLFGAGAIFILTWNASVIAAAIGSFIRNNLSVAAEFLGLSRLIFSLETVTTGLLMYSIHGIPEILAYFTAALAGGIISVAVIKHDFNSENFEKILLDSVDLLVFSLVLLFVAALLEVFVTPLIF